MGVIKGDTMSLDKGSCMRPINATASAINPVSL